MSKYIKGAWVKLLIDYAGAPKGAICQITSLSSSRELAYILYNGKQLGSGVWIEGAWHTPECEYYCTEHEYAGDVTQKATASSTFTVGGWVRCIAEAKSNKLEPCNQFKLGEYYQIKYVNSFLIETKEGYKLMTKGNSAYDQECEWIGMSRPIQHNTTEMKKELTRDDLKIGDWCKILDRGSSQLKTGSIYRINEISTYNAHFDIDGTDKKNNCCWVIFRNLEKVSPPLHESMPSAPSFEYKFIPGERVKITGSGQGVASKEIGKIVMITERGKYEGGFGTVPGYRISPPLGNTLSGSYGGFIGESMFSEYVEPEKEEQIKETFRTGDWVRIQRGNGNWNERMDEYIGREVQLKEEYKPGRFKIAEDGGKWIWTVEHEHFVRIFSHKQPSEMEAKRNSDGIMYAAPRDSGIISGHFIYPDPYERGTVVAIGVQKLPKELLINKKKEKKRTLM